MLEIINQIAEKLIADYGAAGLLSLALAFVIWKFYKILKHQNENHLKSIEKGTKKSLKQNEAIKDNQDEQTEVLNKIHQELKK